MGPNLTSVLIKREDIWIWKCHPREGHVKVKAKIGGWIYRSKMPQIASKPPETGKGRGTDSPLWLQKEPTPTGTSVSDFRPPELVESTFLLFKPLS